MRAAGLLFGIAALMLVAALMRAPAESLPTASTELAQVSFLSAGGESVSSSFAARSTTGELSTGDMTGTTFGVGSGFWAAANCIDDGDGLDATAEASLGTNSCAFDTDDDRQGDGVDACPTKPTFWLTPLGDGDCDGFTSIVETVIGTLPAVACGVNAWPADFDDNAVIDISDALAFKPVFGATVTPALRRYDIDPSAVIDIGDVLALKPVFGASCTA